MSGLGWQYRREVDAWEVRCEREGKTYAHIDGEVVREAASHYPGRDERAVLHALVAMSRGRFALLYTHECPRWESVYASVHNYDDDREASAWEYGHTEFRVSVQSADRRKFAIRLLVDNRELADARHDLYAYTLNKIVAELDKGCPNIL